MGEDHRPSRRSEANPRGRDERPARSAQRTDRPRDDASRPARAAPAKRPADARRKRTGDGLEASPARRERPPLSESPSTQRRLDFTAHGARAGASEGGAGSRSPSPRRPVRVPAAKSHKAAAPDSTPSAEPTEKAREGDRIAKLLARAGVASRRDIERMIEEGRIALHGAALTTPATVLTSLHGVTVDGQPVKEPSPARLFLFYKPVGYLTAARDPLGRPTIYDRLPEDLPRLMPVGRLDFNTEGLLLLTTDGGLKRQLELPSSGIERTYRARAFGTVSQEQLEALIEGVEIDGMRYGRIDANLERRTGRNQWIEMTITEGKNREVRRVLEHLGLEVSRLIRTRYGRFTLDEGKPGDLVEVRQADLVAFRRTLK